MLHHNAEQHAQHRAEHAKHRRPKAVFQADSCRNMCDGKGSRRNPDSLRKPCRNECRNNARHNGGIVHDPNGDNLHREDNRGQRCAEKCRKACRHAAHRHDAPLPLIQLKHPPKAGGNAAAQLECRALSACRAA